uniref:Thioredoxin domain-containing protein n=1 Tax=viral metagenome TaxID=1070528 RepID=A0A6C0BZ20_9ZZZZ
MPAIVRITADGTVAAATAADLQKSSAAVLKVTASWCGPCTRVHPLFVSWCIGNSTCFEAFVLDVDAAETESADSKTLLDVVNASALPTFIAFRDGKETGRFSGACMSSVKLLCQPFLDPQATGESSADGK